MTYIFNHTMSRARREVKKMIYSLLDKEYYGDDVGDDEYDIEEIITEFNACVKVCYDSIIINVDDDNDTVTECDLRYEYRIECWSDGVRKFIGEWCNEYLDPEKYSEYCEHNGDEVRVYNNVTNKLIDSYRYEHTEYTEEISDMCRRIEIAMDNDTVYSNSDNVKIIVR